MARSILVTKLCGLVLAITRTAVTKKIDLQAVVSEHYSAVYRLGCASTKNQSDAADLTQETFLILTKQQDHIREPEKQSPGYLLHFSANFCEDTGGVRCSLKCHSVRKSTMLQPRGQGGFIRLTLNWSYLRLAKSSQAIVRHSNYSIWATCLTNRFRRP